MEKGSALEGFSALYDGTGNSNAIISQAVSTKCVLDSELADLCQKHGGGVSRGRPIGQLPELWPHDMLKRALLGHAAEFIRQIGLEGFAPVSSSLGAFRLWGPYMEKVGDLREWVPEADNPLVTEKRKAARVWGYRGNEWDFSKGVAYIIQGDFVRSAAHGHISEDGQIFV